MNLKNIAIASAVGSLLLIGSSIASADDARKENCYAVAAAGKNDCAGKAHSSAGESKYCHPRPTSSGMPMSTNGPAGESAVATARQCPRSGSWQASWVAE